MECRLKKRILLLALQLLLKGISVVPYSACLGCAGWFVMTSRLTDLLLPIYSIFGVLSKPSSIRK